METVPIGSVYRSEPGTGVMPRGVVGFGNPLAEVPSAAAARLAAEARGGGVVVGWSGWIDGPASSIDGDVESDFRAWSGEGRRGLDALVAAAIPLLEGAGTRLWIRPHARHVLSDGPSCAAFLRAQASVCATGTLGVLLDLDLVLTEPMRGRRAEHVGRMVEMLLPLGGLAAVVVTDSDVALVQSLVAKAGVDGARGPALLRSV